MMLALLLYSSLGAAPALAGTDARVLPPGRSRFSVTYGASDRISELFNSDGASESVTKPYNIELSSRNLRSFSTDLAKLIDLLNSLDLQYDVDKRGNGFYGMSSDPSKPKLGDALSRGFLGVQAAADRKQYNMSYFYGVTEKLSLGVMIPFIEMKVRTANGITGTNTAADIYQIFRTNYPERLGELNAIPGALDILGGSNIETLQNILVSRGYSRFGDHEDQGIGDIVFGGRFNWLKESPRSGDWLSSVDAGVYLPTGRLKHPRELTAQSFGDGAWAVSLAGITNYTPFRLLTLLHSLNYTHRFPHQRLVRVRAHENDALPDASGDEMLDVQLGDKLWTTLGARLNLTRALSFESNYELFWWGRNTYRGARPKDYTYLSEGVHDADGYRETLTLAATLSTIPAFLDSKFPLPGDISATYNHPTRGKNSIIAPFYTFELALYF